MKKGIIKINPITFNPVVQIENGSVLYGGTLRERKGCDTYDIHKSSNDKAFEFLNKKVTITFVQNKFGETLAKIV